MMYMFACYLLKILIFRMKFKVLLVIPARFNSYRLPGKPLKKIGDKTLIQRVYERAKKVNCLKTIIATDDKRILKHCLLN